MQEASAPAKDYSGGEDRPPPARAPPLNPALIPLPDNLPIPCAVSSPVSVPAAQFDSFKNSLNLNNDQSAISISTPIASSQQTRKDSSCINSLKRDSRGGQVNRARSRPTLINSKVSEIYEPMDVDQSADGARRKRSMNFSISNECQSNSTAKKLSTTEGNSSLDSTVPGKTSKIQYSSSDIPPYIVHFHSVENDPIKLLHPLLISRTLSRSLFRHQRNQEDWQGQGLGRDDHC